MPWGGVVVWAVSLCSDRHLEIPQTLRVVTLCQPWGLYTRSLVCGFWMSQAVHTCAGVYTHVWACSQGPR